MLTMKIGSLDRLLAQFVMESLTLDQESIKEGSAVTLSGAFSDPGLGDTHTLEIDWGDGTPAQVLAITDGDRVFDVTHTYREDTGNEPG